MNPLELAILLNNFPIDEVGMLADSSDCDSSISSVVTLAGELASP